MAAPSFLASSFNYVQTLGSADVQDIMDLFATQCAAMSWTNPSADLYKSPVDGSGRFMDILFTRVSATNLTFRVRDHNAFTVGSRSIVISAAPTTNFDIYCGTYHALIVAYNPAQAAREFCGAWIPDCYPDPVSSNTSSYVVMKGYRDTAGSPATVSQNWISQWWANDNGTSTAASRTICWNNGTNPVLISVGKGAIVSSALWVYAKVGGATYYWLGRMPQLLMIYDGVVTQEGMVQLPVSATTVGTFRVVWLGNATTNNMTACIRVA